MITTRNQRWRDRRGSYRPAGETIDPRAFEVAKLDDDNTPKRFVEAHHYSGSFPAARFRFGLYRGTQLAGVAVFSQPMNARALRPLPGEALEGVELGRFVLLDDVPGNGETWFLARCFELLRKEPLVGVVSFSDPTPRATAAGVSVFNGHVGTIYQAFNAIYLGRGTARTLRLLPDGTVLSDRTLQKIRKRERGWRYASAILEAHGAAPLGDEDAHEWVRHWVAALTRAVRHPGNHKYVWGLRPSVRKHLPDSQPYPKLCEVS
jgi:hypothetical protein